MLPNLPPGMTLNPPTGSSNLPPGMTLNQPILNPTSNPDNGGFIRGLIGAPLTMLARPIQAGAELLGASEQKVNEVTKKLTGGLVAPVPTDFSDVKKDVGRGIETTALGLPGLASAGAAFGLGSSLEQGNDLFSLQTAFQTALGAAGAKVLGLIGEPLFNVAGKAIGKITPDFLSNLAKEGTKAIEDFAAQHNILPDFVSKPLNAGVKSLESLVAKPFEAIGGAKTGITNLLQGKTEAEILATPESEIKNLSKNERNLWYQAQQKNTATETQNNLDKLATDYKIQQQKLVDDFRNNKIQSTTDYESKQAELDKKFQAQQNAIKQTHATNVEQATQKNNITEAQIKADLQAKTDASLAETIKLKSEVDKASVEEAGNLKKPVIQIYKNNSNQFQKLFEEEFTPKKQAVKLKQADLISKLDNEFANDPFSNPKDKLGLDPNGKSITAKDFYDRVRGLKTSAPGMKGTSTFTANDLAINRTRGVLNEVLGDKGVDLTKANEFWREWKPLQREITAKVKPFEPGYKTGTMAGILQNSASAVGDAKNAKFITDLESQLGEKIGGKTRVAVENLTTLQKQMIADKVASEEAKVEAQLAKDKAINESKQALENNTKNLKDNYIKSKEALDKANKETAQGLTEKNITDKRKLEDNYTQSKRALEDAQVKASEALKSRQFETERQAQTSKKEILKKILKGVGILTGTGLTAEGIKRVVTGSF